MGSGQSMSWVVGRSVCLSVYRLVYCSAVTIWRLSHQGEPAKRFKPGGSHTPRLVAPGDKRRPICHRQSGLVGPKPCIDLSEFSSEQILKTPRFKIAAFLKLRFTRAVSLCSDFFHFWSSSKTAINVNLIFNWEWKFWVPDAFLNRKRRHYENYICRWPKTRATLQVFF